MGTQDAQSKDGREGGGRRDRQDEQGVHRRGDSLGSIDDYHLLSGEGIADSELKDVDKELERMTNMGELKEMTSEEFRDLMGGDANGGNLSVHFNPPRKSQKEKNPSRFSQMSFLNDDFQQKEDSHFSNLNSKSSRKRDSHLSLGNMRNSSIFNLSVTDDNGKRWSHNYNSGGNERSRVSLSRTDNAYDSDLITPSPSKGQGEGGSSEVEPQKGGPRRSGDLSSQGRDTRSGRRSIDVLEEELNKLKRGFLLNNGENSHMSDKSNEDPLEGAYVSDSEFLKRTSLDKKISVDLNFGNDDSLTNSRLSNGSCSLWESRISNSRKIRVNNETPKKGILKQSNSFSPIKELPDNISARKKSVQFSHRSIAVFDDKEKVSPLHLTHFTRISSDSNKSEMKRSNASNDSNSDKEKVDTFHENLANSMDKSPIDELLYRYDSFSGVKRSSIGYPIDGNAPDDFIRRMSSESLRFKTKTSVDMVQSARLSPIKNRSKGVSSRKSNPLDGDNHEGKEENQGQDEQEDVLHKLLTTDIDNIKEEDFLKFSLLSDSGEFRSYGRVDSGEKTYERAPSERSKGGARVTHRGESHKGVEADEADEDGAQGHMEDKSIHRREGDKSEVFYECNDSVVSVARRAAAGSTGEEGTKSNCRVKEEEGKARSGQEGEEPDDPLDAKKSTSAEALCKEEELRHDTHVGTIGRKSTMERLPIEEAVPNTENVTIQYRASTHRRSEHAKGVSTEDASPQEDKAKENRGESGNSADGDAHAASGGHLGGEAQPNGQSSRQSNRKPNGQPNRQPNALPNKGDEPNLRRFAEGRNATKRETINVGLASREAENQEAQKNSFRVAKANRRASYSVSMHARDDEAQTRFRDRKSLNERGETAGKSVQMGRLSGKPQVGAASRMSLRGDNKVVEEEGGEGREAEEVEEVEHVEDVEEGGEADEVPEADEDKEAVLRKAELFNRGGGQQYTQQRNYEGEEVHVEEGPLQVAWEEPGQVKARGRYTTHIGQGAFRGGSSDDLQEMVNQGRANSDEGNYKKYVYDEVERGEEDVGEGFPMEDDLDLAAEEEAFRSADMEPYGEGEEMHEEEAEQRNLMDDAEQGNFMDDEEQRNLLEQSRRRRREENQELKKKLNENLIKKQEMIKQMTLAIVRRCRISSLRELKSNRRNLTNLMQLYQHIRDMMFSFVGKINHLNNVSVKLDDAILKYEVTQLRCSRTKKAIETLKKYNGKMEMKVKEKKNLLTKQDNVLDKKMKKIEEMTKELTKLKNIYNEGSSRKQEIHLINLYKRKMDELKSLEMVKGLIINNFNKYGINFEVLNCNYYNFATLYDYERMDSFFLRQGEGDVLMNGLDPNGEETGQNQQKGQTTSGVATGGAIPGMTATTTHGSVPTQEEHLRKGNNPPLYDISDLYERGCRLRSSNKKGKRSATILNSQVSEEDMNCAWPYNITIDIIFCNMNNVALQKETDNYMVSSPVKIKNMKHLIANKMHLLGGESGGVAGPSAEANRKYIKLFRPYKIQTNSFDNFKDITLTTYYKYISSDTLYLHIWNKRHDRESYSLRVNNLKDDGRQKRRKQAHLLRKDMEFYSYYCSDSHVGVEWKLQLEIVKYKLLEVVNRRLQRYTNRESGNLVSGNANNVHHRHLNANDPIFQQKAEAGTAKPNKEALMYLVEEAEYASIILNNVLSQYKHLLKCFLCLSNTFFDYHQDVVIFKTIVLSQQICPHAFWLYLYINLEEAFTFASLLHGIVQVKVESVDEDDKYSEECKTLNSNIVKTLQQCIFALKSKPLDLSERINSYNVVDVIYAVVMNENYNFHSYQNNLEDNIKKLTSCDTFINGVVSKNIVVPIEIKK
ncbi:hypothetical protein C922_04399 [Plasmodium inui San Antonio 1]|uniref:Uncharacterized protein n=1 Tax=Plasmodium inui San Antonio 1 TaxID=1237626 RepID=W7A0W3_9APIC|nr:hypothetical protein C922_04399 [Plasmodium inui San Antonio 1]EUD65270.1 hypothetical protein C922_04399 [Plasmodium inui San Antonio 1]